MPFKQVVLLTLLKYVHVTLMYNKDDRGKLWKLDQSSY